MRRMGHHRPHRKARYPKQGRSWCVRPGRGCIRRILVHSILGLILCFLRPERDMGHLVRDPPAQDQAAPVRRISRGPDHSGRPVGGLHRPGGVRIPEQCQHHVHLADSGEHVGARGEAPVSCIYTISCPAHTRMSAQTPQRKALHLFLTPSLPLSPQDNDKCYQPTRSFSGTYFLSSSGVWSTDTAFEALEVRGRDQHYT
jgi:hypothetical protein